MSRVKYIRVSTTEQNIDRQAQDGLKVYVDQISGSVPFADRPQAKKLIKAIEAGKVDAVHVHSIDRLGRNTLDILTTIKDLTAQGVNVVAQKEGLQTLVNGEPNPTANLILGIMATLAEYELMQIKERQREGIAQAKARGAYKANGGSTKKTTEQLLSKAANAACVKEFKRGESIRRAAKLSGVSMSTAQRIKKMMQEQKML